MNTTYYHCYKFNNILEKDLMLEYFNIQYFNDNCVYFYTTEKFLRKIKLLILKNDDISKIIKNIYCNTTSINHDDLNMVILKDYSNIKY